jgi:hypothetical protein
MKQKDIILILVIAFISAVASILISKILFAAPATHQQQVEVVQPIVSDFPHPDTRYFSKDAFDPTKLITIGQNANPDPFSGSSH